MRPTSSKKCGAWSNIVEKTICVPCPCGNLGSPRSYWGPWPNDIHCSLSCLLFQDSVFICKITERLLVLSVKCIMYIFGFLLLAGKGPQSVLVPSQSLVREITLFMLGYYLYIPDLLQHIRGVLKCVQPQVYICLYDTSTCLTSNMYHILDTSQCKTSSYSCHLTKTSILLMWTLKMPAQVAVSWAVAPHLLESNCYW